MTKMLRFAFIVSLIFLTTSCNNNEQVLNLSNRQLPQLALKDNIPNNFLAKELKIVAVGDSLTEGVGDSSNSGGYLPYLESYLNDSKSVKSVQYTNYGVKGNRTDQLLKRLANDEVKKSITNANLIIITIGGNDIMKVARENFLDLQLHQFKSAQENYVKNLNEIMKSIRASNSNAAIVFVGLYNPFLSWFSDLKELNAIVGIWNDASERTVLSYENSYFVETAETFENASTNLLYKDNFHPNDEGYEQIALLISEKIRNEVVQNIES